MFNKSNLETMKHIRLRRPQPHLLSTSVVNLVIKTLFGTSLRPLALFARGAPCGAHSGPRPTLERC